MSWWGAYPGNHLNIAELQGVLIENWKPYMEQTHVTLMGATCYESHLRYPTAVKLLWGGIAKVYGIVQQKRNSLKLRKQLLKYLLRLMQGLDSLQHKQQFNYSNKESRVLNTITAVYEQQHELLYGNSEKIPHRIVSICKPYIRPIVRGKEIKPVEFGADGIYATNENRRYCRHRIGRKFWQ